MLVPIRVDASVPDGSARLIDTILLDTKCLPVQVAPKDPFCCGDGSYEYINSVIDANAIELARDIVADAEVQGTTRPAAASRHFSGRVGLLNGGARGRESLLLRRVEEQIRSQLGAALRSSMRGETRGQRMTRRRSSTQGEDDEREGAPAGRTKRSRADAGNDGGTDGTAADRVESFSSKLQPSESDSGGNGDDGLVKIHLRLRQDNVVVVDEFKYDASSKPRTGGCPIALANGIASDLNLPRVLGPSIAVSIVEQIHGLDVDSRLDGMANGGSGTSARAAASRDVPAAFRVDVKDGAMASACVAADCRPSSATKAPAVAARSSAGAVPSKSVGAVASSTSVGASASSIYRDGKPGVGLC